LLDKIEDKIFKHFGDDIIEGVAHVKRQILDFIRALKPQKAVWDSAHDVMTNFWGEGLKPYVSDVVADYNRMVHFTDIHREVADSLHVTSSSLLDNRRNYVIKILTVFTAILLPLSLVASIYGMNLKYLPFADNPYAFWWFFGGMLTTTIVSVTLLKKNKWL
jgi:magnesium transporter